VRELNDAKRLGDFLLDSIDRLLQRVDASRDQTQRLLELFDGRDVLKQRFVICRHLRVQFASINATPLLS
jgi:hypothetical protein